MRTQASRSLMPLLTMFNISLLLIIIAGGSSATAAPLAQTGVGGSTPMLFSYTGMLRDQEGRPLTGAYTLTFRLYDDVAEAADTGACAAGNAVWCEQHTDVTVRDGQFGVMLGSLTQLPKAPFETGDLFLGITVAGFDEMTPRQRLASVPYAISAERAHGLSAPDGNPYDVVTVNENGKVFVTGTGGGLTLTAGGKALTLGFGAETDIFAENSELYISSGAGRALRLQAGGQGDVLVGTNLSVANDIAAGNSIRSNSIIAEGGGKRIVMGIGGEVDLYSDTSNLFIQNNARNVYISPGAEGRVGIGTFGPAAKLDVHGDIRVRGDWPIFIARYENIGINHELPFNTGFRADQWNCTATGWLLNVHIIEDPGNYGFWAYTRDGFWWLWADWFSGRGRNVDYPDVDLLCVRKELGGYSGNPAVFSPD